MVCIELRGSGASRQPRMCTTGPFNRLLSKCIGWPRGRGGSGPGCGDPNGCFQHPRSMTLESRPEEHEAWCLRPRLWQGGGRPHSGSRSRSSPHPQVVLGGVWGFREDIPKLGAPLFSPQSTRALGIAHGIVTKDLKFERCCPSGPTGSGLGWGRVQGQSPEP